ncbi:DUF2254 domain-containing protein [Finegoldia magna]|uniref:DUF2254 domain-containing protein n=1 Tax=Finegoldia magna TaxID=1260 RepID=UPI0023A9F6D6|nr:DUF2254 domain-containing protein [Finegoldia magna]MCC2718085.1 DUF2254 domain-containing protein [Finegoldia magna]
MLSKIKLWFFNHKNFLRMSRFLILTVSLLLVTWIFDHQYIEIKSYIPKQLLLSVEVSIDFLSNISGIFLTISTFCFTIIVTVLNKYSSSISPRMLQSFIDRTGVLGLYGIFVSGFFYSVISILLLQDIAPDQHVIAGSLGIAYSIIAMLSFIAFSRQVLDNIKVSNVIEYIFNDCEKLIDKEVELRKKAKHYEVDDESTKLSIVAESSGYLFGIKADEIFKELDGIRAELVINKRIGEYTIKGETLGELNIFECKLDDDEKKELKEKLSLLFLINAYNNREEDYHRGIVNLTEIANMALSPGTNDPNTAIICINKMSSLLGKLLSAGNHFIIMKEDEDVKIIYQSYSVEDELYLGFSQIISYSAGDPLVTKAILEGIFIIYTMADIDAKKSIKEFFDDSYEILIENFTHEIHLDIFKRIRNKMEEHVSL